MEVTIDCRQIHSQEDFHDAMASKLRLPDFYGENLDALYDCLTSIGHRTTINLIGVQALLNNLSSYGRAAINAMERAERENCEFLTINML